MVNQFLFLIIISIVGLVGTLLLISVQQNRAPYVSDLWYIICAIGWFICYLAGLAGMVLTVY